MSRQLNLRYFAPLFTAAALMAQDATGRIVGVVTDPQGSAIADARITVINAATKETRDTTTNGEGTYQVLNVPIGLYQVTAEKSGFRKVLTGANQLSINQSLRIDIHMEVGSVSELVQVEAAASAVETVNSTLGQVVNAESIVDAPLNGRNVLDLALLVPGVTEQRPNGGPAGFPFSISGGRTDSVTFLLDGGLNNNLLNNGVVYNPNPDTVAEFRILTSNYTAEYGRSGGGIVSVVTKSGTNSLHGSAYDYLRNDALNANLFFNNLNGAARPVLKRNQFGATMGGPVVIPKVFNGRDKVFFFSSYQGQRQSDVRTSPAVTTFTPAELKGDFSHSSASGGPDSGVAAFLQKNPFFQPNAGLAAQAIIDPTRINSIAQKYIGANLIPTSATGRLFPLGAGKSDNDEFTNKVDIAVSQHDRISVTLGAARAPTLSPFSFATSPNGYGTTGAVHRYFGNVAYTKIFTPSLLNDFRFTAQRHNGVQSVPQTDLPTASQLGIGITPDHPTGPPIVGFSASGMTIGFSPQGPTTLINNTYSYSDTLTWIRGKHNLKFGGYFSPYQNNTVYDFYVNGQFFFHGPSGQGGIGSANDRADFLLGLPDEFQQFGEAPSDVRSRTYSAFAQDEWHARRNLVITFGIRYDYSTPKIDTRGRSFSLKPGQQSTVFTKAPVGMLFPGDAGAPKGANFPDKNDWAPRFGFAWDPTGKGKTSVRGGFGVFYDVLKAEDNLQFNGQAPFFGFADLFFDPLSANPSRESNYLSNPFVATGIPNSFPSRPPARDLDFGKAGFLPVGGGGVYFVDPNLRTPYIYHYNLSLQQQLMWNMAGEMDYVGSSAHKLTGLLDSNPFILGTTNRVFNTQPGNTATSFSYLDTFANVANQSYNSLQASLQKQGGETRFLGRTSFRLSYTYAHSIDNASGFRERNGRVPFYNHNAFRASSDEDIRHRLVFSGVWALPFGKGLSHGLNRVVGGWTVYPIATWRTGYPLDVLAGISRSRTRTGPSAAGDPNLVHADLVGSSINLLDPKQPQTFRGRTGNYYFDPANFSIARFNQAFYDAALANPALRTYGTLPRNALLAPGRTNFDLALAKSTPIIGERLMSQLRVEFFNILNHTELREPNTTISSGTFGQISQTYDPRIIQLALRLTW